jgi:hypothetical protein
MIKYISTLIFGKPASGEPAFVKQKPIIERNLDGFFEWCREFNVSCRAKNKGIYY